MASILSRIQHCGNFGANQPCSHSFPFVDFSEYLKKDLIQFAKEHPHVEVIVTPRPSKHPVIRGLYRTFNTLYEMGASIMHEVPLLISNIHSAFTFRPHSQWKGQGCMCTQHGANRHCRQGCSVEGVLRQQDEDIQEARHLHYGVGPWYLVTLPRCSPQDLKVIVRSSCSSLQLSLFSLFFFFLFLTFTILRIEKINNPSVLSANQTRTIPL